ncbi:hypothetical protein L218DRAFT_1027777 [Marasmius fiardii PR-910]|nr:hypothetical protein L218DRAFT_1027777 [Marasmius fiardii PR-910]
MAAWPLSGSSSTEPKPNRTFAFYGIRKRAIGATFRDSLSHYRKGLVLVQIQGPESGKNVLVTFLIMGTLTTKGPQSPPQADRLSDSIVYCSVENTVITLTVCISSSSKEGSSLQAHRVPEPTVSGRDSSSMGKDAIRTILNEPIAEFAVGERYQFASSYIHATLH